MLESRAEMRKRGSTVQNPANTKYSLASWTKGYLAWLAVFPLYLFLWAFASTFRRLPNWLLRKLLRDHQAVVESRNPDVRIPGDLSIPAYMLRWWKIKRNAFFNCYYHIVRRSDDDTALHDHPWWNFSIVLVGEYYEHLILPGGVHQKTKYGPGAVRFRRSGNFAHRLELERYGPNAWPFVQDEEIPVHTIFITGPVLRRWGFHHPLQWVDAYDWDDFLQQQGVNANRMGGYAEQNASAGRALDGKVNDAQNG